MKNILLYFTLCFIVLPLTLFSQQSSEGYYAGTGGRGMTLAVLPTDGEGLDRNLLTIVQGTLVSVVQRYSAIAVTDRVSLDKLLAESLDAIYEDNMEIVRLGHVKHAQYWLISKITKTSSSSTLYNFQITITDFSQNPPSLIASYSGNCNIAQLEDHSAIHRASKDILARMGVQLTARAIGELDATVAENKLVAQQNNARGYEAQRQGNEVAALNYYFQAADIDPSLFEAVNRSNVMFAIVSTGNIGVDARNDARWRDEWESRLKEIEVLYNDLLSSADPPFTLFYATDIKREGVTDYDKNTLAVKFSANMRANGKYFITAIKALEKVTQTYYDGLVATRRAGLWGFSEWPNRGRTNNNPFNKQYSYTFNVAFELLNAQGQVIGSKTQDLSRSFTISRTSGNKIWTTFEYDKFASILVPNINMYEYTDEQTAIRIASINGRNPQQAKIAIIALSEQVFNDYRTSSNTIKVENGVLTGFSPNVKWESGYTYDLIFPKMMWREPIRDIFTVIGDDAFRGKQLTSVTLPEGITHIGKNAFYGNLIGVVTIPHSVVSIAEGAFGGRNQGSVSIGEKVRIEYGAFEEGFLNCYYNQYNRKAGTYESSGYYTWGDATTAFLQWNRVGD